MRLVQGLLSGFKRWGKSSGLVDGKNGVNQKEFFMRYVVVFGGETLCTSERRWST